RSRCRGRPVWRASVSWSGHGRARRRGGSAKPSARRSLLAAGGAGLDVGDDVVLVEEGGDRAVVGVDDEERREGLLGGHELDAAGVEVLGVGGGGAPTEAGLGAEGRRGAVEAPGEQVGAVTVLGLAVGEQHDEVVPGHGPDLLAGAGAVLSERRGPPGVVGGRAEGLGERSHRLVGVVAEGGHAQPVAAQHDLLGTGRQRGRRPVTGPAVGAVQVRRGGGRGVAVARRVVAAGPGEEDRRGERRGDGAAGAHASPARRSSSRIPPGSPWRMYHSMPKERAKASSGRLRKNESGGIWLAWAAIDARLWWR